MRFLLDTHVVLWAMMDDPRLTTKARELLTVPDAEKLVSVVSLWEMLLKRASKPASLNISVAQATAFVAEGGAEILPLRASHVTAFESLPQLHRDPYDRMIVAQAIEGSLRLITHDRVMASYSPSFILV